jgi:EF-P beta-lysylation protein EpmB
VHCRYCFRRNFPYSEQNAATAQWQNALEYIAADASINEVILSGGDPLTLDDSKLLKLCKKLANIPHIKTLRLHTRLPVVLPERIDKTFVRWFSDFKMNKVVVLHANHAQEFSAEVRIALRRLKSTGATLLNQTVLLRGVNDTADTLCELSEILFENNVLPYYLHCLDRVQGAAHFDVPRGIAQHIYRGLRTRLPGYLVPQLVVEHSGAPYKLPLI